jgi:hypothetical protein
MRNIIGFVTQKFVAGALALAVTGLIAWSVSDSIISVPSGQIAVLAHTL